MTGFFLGLDIAIAAVAHAIQDRIAEDEATVRLKMFLAKELIVMQTECLRVLGEPGLSDEEKWAAIAAAQDVFMAKVKARLS